MAHVRMAGGRGGWAGGPGLLGVFALPAPSQLGPPSEGADHADALSRPPQAAGAR